MYLKILVNTALPPFLLMVGVVVITIFFYNGNKPHVLNAYCDSQYSRHANLIVNFLLRAKHHGVGITAKVKRFWEIEEFPLILIVTMQQKQRKGKREERKIKEKSLELGFVYSI